MIPKLSSDLEHYLNTNVAPVGADAAKAREILRTVQSHPSLNHVDDALGIPGEIEMTDATKVVRDCNIILSPIRRLPLDVTRAILFACLPTAWENNDPFADPPDSFYNNQGSFNIRLAPWVFSHVCSEWRSISLSTSPLWSHLTICMPRLIHRHARKQFPILDILDTHLQRSGTYPLTIIFWIARDTTRFMVEEIFSRLLAQSHRWEKIFFKMDDTLITKFPHHLPLLQHSTIIPTTTIPSFEPTMTPRLRKVSIQRNPPRPPPPFRHLIYPWAQITSFTGASIYAWDVLPNAPNLLEFIGNDTFVDVVDAQPQLPVHHLKLQRLEFDVNALQWLGSLPSLTALKIFGASFNPDIVHWEPRIVAAFLRRASCSLTILDIDEVTFSDANEVAELFSLAPSLTKLRVFYLSPFLSAGNFLPPLTLGDPSSRDEDFLLNLEVLDMNVLNGATIAVHGIEQFAYDNFVTVLESRCTGNRDLAVSRLRRVECMTPRDPVGPELLGRIEKLRAEGLEMKERTSRYRVFPRAPEYVLK